MDPKSEHAGDDLRNAMAAGTSFEAMLDIALARAGCVVGTIHRFDAATRQLLLLAERGIPEAIVPQIRRIPIGKGMAGLAAQRRACVSVCNLQADDSGAAKPGARLTGMEGSIAVPMLVDNELRGVLGVAKPTAYEFNDSEKKRLLAMAAQIGERL